MIKVRVKTSFQNNLLYNKKTIDIQISQLENIVFPFFL